MTWPSSPPRSTRTSGNSSTNTCSSDGQRLYVLGEGRLINLAAAHGHPASVMDMSFAAQALATEWSIKNKDSLEHKVHEVPKEVDQFVASLSSRPWGSRSMP